MSVINLPSIRSLLKPDPGYVLIDADLERADAQVVAWDSGAEKLKAIFRSGADVHLANAQSIWGQHAGKFERQLAKMCVHAVNYNCKARTLAVQAGISIADADDFIFRWFREHPEIPRWHARVENQLRLSRCVRNAWGFRRFYFDRLDNLLSQALAWIGQSTVSVTINKAMLELYKHAPEIQLLLQVHDSLVMQAPASMCPNIFGVIKTLMELEIPYPDPLTIAVGIKYGHNSWGELTKFDKLTDWKEAA